MRSKTLAISALTTAALAGMALLGGGGAIPGVTADTPSPTPTPYYGPPVGQPVTQPGGLDYTPGSSQIPSYTYTAPDGTTITVPFPAPPPYSFGFDPYGVPGFFAPPAP